MFNVFAFEKKEREKLEKAINKNKEKELNSKKSKYFFEIRNP